MSNRSFLVLALVLAFSAVGGCAMERGDDLAGGSDSALTSHPYFEVFQGADDAWYFNLSAANHEIILSSQSYSSRSAALSGVLSVMDNGETSGRYDLREASNGQFYFNLKAANGRVIGTSETYTTRSSAQRAIETTVRNVGEYLDYLANRTGRRFDVFRGTDGRYFFSLHAGNGAIVLRSQGYTTEAAALNATFSVADNGVDAARYDVRPSADGGYYFNLKASNGQVIGTSEVYSSQSNATRGRDSIIELLPTVELL